jgi:hypothetical protein
MPGALADRSVVAVRLLLWRGGGGAKGPGHPWLCSFDQPETGGVAWTS